MAELLDIKNTRFRDETGCFLELLGRFESGYPGFIWC